ncbi:unnamed protein product [marine sediment metagenome]|uniref:Uncharacterized protein n=1 Tax=marine sediment metagenome TaxID=412755 RepID=X0YHF0_9ZZZZ
MGWPSYGNAFAGDDVTSPFPPNPDEPVDLPIAPGTTWTDVAGNTWTAYGNLVMSDDSIQSVRQNLTAFLQSRHTKWNWYNAPPDNLKVPAVVCSPSDPYVLPFTQGSKGSVVWGLDYVIVASRAKPDQALRRLEFFMAEIYQTLLEYPSAQFLQFSQVGTTEIGGVEHMTALLEVAVYSKLLK